MANIAEPAMEAAIDARPKELNEVQVERAFATPEEASAYSTAVLSLGNVRPWSHSHAIQQHSTAHPF